MQQADMRIDTLDDLAVELHDEAQHAVRRGMLRTEVDRVVLNRHVAGRRIGGIGDVHQFVDIVAHWFCPWPLVGITSDAAGLSPPLLPACGSPAPVCDGASVVFGSFVTGAAFGCVGASALTIVSAFSGVGAPLASGTMPFSSPGSTYCAPSHGLWKSKLRKSCAS
ncbi:hypothetical protein WR25_19057 [Diploscapter pachys]|uniref:Uncharacterized protein n=1 Tax=Diploscapter pachys TaxID=2018661 RepID=A0A2A2M511_9BILA|nr:hypothetical protein WR25_19057 [Diploscapter pachys]